MGGGDGKSRKRRSSPSPSSRGDISISSSEEEERRSSSKKSRKRDDGERRSRRKGEDKKKRKSHGSHRRSREEKDEKKKSKEKKRLKEMHNSRRKDLDSFVELTKDDYFSKNNEFSAWLKEERGTFFSDLSSEAARLLFSSFIQEWNSGKLQSQYYEGIASGTRSAHNWKIRQ